MRFSEFHPLELKNPSLNKSTLVFFFIIHIPALFSYECPPFWGSFSITAVSLAESTTPWPDLLTSIQNEWAVSKMGGPHPFFNSLANPLLLEYSFEIWSEIQGFHYLCCVLRLPSPILGSATETAQIMHGFYCCYNYSWQISSQVCWIAGAT